MAETPNTTRRAFLSALPGYAAAGALATVLPATAAEPSTIDFHAKTIARHLADRGEKWAVIVDAKSYQIDFMHAKLPAEDRAKILAVQLAETMNEINPGSWFAAVRANDGYVLIERKSQS